MPSRSAVFVQARLDSSRLPGKVLLPLGDEGTLLSAVLNNLHGCADTHVLLCPQDAQSALAPIAESCGYRLIVGPKEDVLARFALGLKEVEAQWIIRATADNPVVSAQLAKQLLSDAQRQGADYACFAQTPHGGGVEVISAKALICADKEAKDTYDREHVCPFIYNNEGRFCIYKPLAPAQWMAPQLRATVDTLSDYKYMCDFYQFGAKNSTDILENFIAWAMLKKGK